MRIFSFSFSSLPMRIYSFFLLIVPFSFWKLLTLSVLPSTAHSWPVFSSFFLLPLLVTYVCLSYYSLCPFIHSSPLSLLGLSRPLDSKPQKCFGAGRMSTKHLSPVARIRLFLRLFFFVVVVTLKSLRACCPLWVPKHLFVSNHCIALITSFFIFIFWSIFHPWFFYFLDLINRFWLSFQNFHFTELLRFVSQWYFCSRSTSIHFLYILFGHLLYNIFD